MALKEKPGRGKFNMEKQVLQGCLRGGALSALGSILLTSGQKKRLPELGSGGHTRPRRARAPWCFSPRLKTEA